MEPLHVSEGDLAWDISPIVEREAQSGGGDPGQPVRRALS
jgi:hypothetical protein